MARGAGASVLSAAVAGQSRPIDASPRRIASRSQTWMPAASERHDQETAVGAEAERGDVPRLGRLERRQLPAGLEVDELHEAPRPAIASTRPSGLKAAWPGKSIAPSPRDAPAQGPRADVPDRVFFAGGRHEPPAVGAEEHVGAALDGQLADQGAAAGVPDLHPAALPGAGGHPGAVGAEVQPLQARVAGERDGRPSALQVEDQHAADFAAVAVDDDGQGPAVAAESDPPGGEAGQRPERLGGTDPEGAPGRSPDGPSEQAGHPAGDQGRPVRRQGHPGRPGQVDEGRSRIPAGILEPHARLAGRDQHAVAAEEVDRPGPRPGALVADQRPTLDALGHFPEPHRGAGEPRAEEPPVAAEADRAGLGQRAPHEFLGRTGRPRVAGSRPSSRWPGAVLGAGTPARRPRRRGPGMSWGAATGRPRRGG